MKEQRIKISTTHVDKHGDRITLKAYEGLLKEGHGLYFPVGMEHDPRIPPVGRTRELEITELEDGEHALIGISELFEPGDDLPYNPEGKLLPRPYSGEAGAFISYDRNFQDVESQALVREVAALIGAEPQWEIKKALDPIAVLAIGFAGLAIGQIANGFFSRVGEDGYDALKAGLTKLLARPKDGEQDRLLRFQALVQSGEDLVEVNVILTNPTAEDLDLLLSRGLKLLDERVVQVLESNQPIHSITYEFTGGELRMTFAVRKDCVPLLLKKSGE